MTQGIEKLLHYVWKHKMFPLDGFRTQDGQVVEVLDVGLHNNDAGPDFFNAKIRIGNQVWAGNVELHLKSSQWYQHGHQKDHAYDNVVLHVVCEVDSEVRNSCGELIPQTVLPIPAALFSNYEHLLTEDRYPRCFRIIPSLPKVTLHSWLSALQTERLERKTTDILQRLDRCCGSWEDAFFQTLARNFGFGVNADAFETWAQHIPLKAVDHHRDDLFQIEALFLGQAGLLREEAYPERHRNAVAADEYFARMKAEYTYLAHKFSLQPMDSTLWRFLRLRPQNFPTVRLSQLALLHYNRKADFSQIMECTSTGQIAAALQTQATDYWQTHYLFGEQSARNAKRLSRSSIDVLLINTVIPTVFAYGKYTSSSQFMNRALDLMEQLKAEDNNIVRMWRECGLDVTSASDTQALIQLKKEYCDRKDCLRCRIGYHYLKRNG
jgi:hypothetical protein